MAAIKKALGMRRHAPVRSVCPLGCSDGGGYMEPMHLESRKGRVGCSEEFGLSLWFRAGECRG